MKPIKRSGLGNGLGGVVRNTHYLTECAVHDRNHPEVGRRTVGGALSRRDFLQVYDPIDAGTYGNRAAASEAWLIDELNDVLNRVVERQIVSDVPLATICSDGVESSPLTAIVAQ